VTRRIVNYLRDHALATTALVFSILALAGSSYAAVTLPAGSVGTTQLRNGAVTARKIAKGTLTPSKLDGRAIGGYVREWAYVRQDGVVLGGSKGARASVGGNQYTITWHARFSSRCGALVTPAATPGIASIADATGVAVSEPVAPQPTTVYVWTYSHGTATPAPFYVAVIC
jgi:hypothetical protein